MALTAKVPKKLSGIKTKIMLNLTKRQLICFGAAALAGFPAYLLLKDAVGTDIAVIFMVILMLPFFFFAIYEKNGHPAEQMLKMMWMHKWGRPQRRAYRSENLYLRFIREEKAREMAAQNKQKARLRLNIRQGHKDSGLKGKEDADITVIKTSEKDKCRECKPAHRYSQDFSVTEGKEAADIRERKRKSREGG